VEWPDRLRRSSTSSEYGQPSRGRVPTSLFYAGLVLFIVLTIIALSAGPLFSLLLVVLIAAVAFLPRHMRRSQLINDLFQRTRKITREEEWEADIAQDRRRILHFLTGNLVETALRTYYENVRKTVRPGKYIQVEFTPLSLQEITTDPMRAWLPDRNDIVLIRRRWSPLFEPTVRGNEQLQRLKAQVEAFLGVETEMREDLVRCYADFEPVRYQDAEPPPLADGDRPTTPI
jgi:hypothetical protein